MGMLVFLRIIAKLGSDQTEMKCQTYKKEKIGIAVIAMTRRKKIQYYSYCMVNTVKADQNTMVKMLLWNYSFQWSKKIKIC